MDIKCIALDLDRTTLDADGLLSPGNRAALEYAISKGVHIVIASGRGFASLPKDVTSIQGIEYAITSNGAAVYHLPTASRLRAYPLTPASACDILLLTEGEPAVLEAFVDGLAFADTAYVKDPAGHGASKEAVPYIQSTRHPVSDIRSYIKEHIHELECLDLIVRNEADKTRLWNMLESNVQDIYITSSVPHLIEISHKDSGKHAGICYIADLLGLSPAQIAAFGDGDNDTEMLDFVGCGIAVENASPSCQAAANAVTKSHDQDGVAWAIYHILQI